MVICVIMHEYIVVLWLVVQRRSDGRHLVIGEAQEKSKTQAGLKKEMKQPNNPKLEFQLGISGILSFLAASPHKCVLGTGIPVWVTGIQTFSAAQCTLGLEFRFPTPNSSSGSFNIRFIFGEWFSTVRIAPDFWMILESYIRVFLTQILVRKN